MAKLVDASDLKSEEQKCSCRFESCSEYQALHLIKIIFVFYQKPFAKASSGERFPLFRIYIALIVREGYPIHYFRFRFLLNTRTLACESRSPYQIYESTEITYKTIPVAHRRPCGTKGRIHVRYLYNQILVR